MKRIKWITIAIICITLYAASCKKDDIKDEETPKNDLPILNLKQLPGYTYEDAQLYNEQIIIVGIVAEQPDSAELEKLQVFRRTNNNADQELYLEHPINKASCNYDISITKGSEATETFTFIIKNEYGEEVSKSLEFSLLGGSAPAPTIEFIAGGNDAFIAEGDEYFIHIEANQTGGNMQLHQFVLSVNVDGNTQIVLDTLIQGTNFNYSKTIIKGSANIETWMFNVTNNANQMAGAYVTLSRDYESFFEYENNSDGVIWHAWGSGNGAFDLVNNVPLMCGDINSNKDMINTTIASGDPFVFGWKSHTDNGTIFVDVTGSYDYATATVGSAANAYAAGSNTTEVADVATGDIFIAKLRGGTEYCVIVIDDASAYDPKSGEGYISFSYKKTSEFAGQ